VVNINVEASVKGTLGSSVTAWYPGGECEDGSSTFFYNFVDLPTSVRPMAVIVLKPGMRVMFFIREGRITAAINDPTPVGESAQGEKP
jgi:hypothetical protein